MSVQICRLGGSGVEREAAHFIAKLLAGDLSAQQFERLVGDLWKTSRFFLQTDKLAHMLKAAYSKRDSLYASDYGANVQKVNFSSKWMTHASSEVPAIYIEAPAETDSAPQTTDKLNRPMHCHPSSRAAIITEGRAAFYFSHLDVQTGERKTVALPVSVGDVVFWPGGTPHTFNAQEGFALLSVLGSREGHSRDGYSQPHSECLDINQILWPTVIDQTPKDLRLDVA